MVFSIIIILFLLTPFSSIDFFKEKKKITFTFYIETRQESKSSHPEHPRHSQFF